MINIKNKVVKIDENEISYIYGISFFLINHLKIKQEL